MLDLYEVFIFGDEKYFYFKVGNERYRVLSIISDDLTISTVEAFSLDRLISYIIRRVCMPFYFCLLDVQQLVLKYRQN